MKGNLARRDSGGGSMAQGRGWFAIPRAEIGSTRWVTLLPTSMFHFHVPSPYPNPDFEPSPKLVPRWTQVTRKLDARLRGGGWFRNGRRKSVCPKGKVQKIKYRRAQSAIEVVGV